MATKKKLSYSFLAIELRRKLGTLLTEADYKLSKTKYGLYILNGSGNVFFSSILLRDVFEFCEKFDLKFCVTTRYAFSGGVCICITFQNSI